jgi:hypothetical protein
MCDYCNASALLEPLGRLRARSTVKADGKFLDYLAELIKRNQHCEEHQFESLRQISLAIDGCAIECPSKWWLGAPPRELVLSVAAAVLEQVELEPAPRLASVDPRIHDSLYAASVGWVVMRALCGGELYRVKAGDFRIEPWRNQRATKGLCPLASLAAAAAKKEPAQRRIAGPRAWLQRDLGRIAEVVDLDWGRFHGSFCVSPIETREKTPFLWAPVVNSCCRLVWRTFRPVRPMLNGAFVSHVNAAGHRALDRLRDASITRETVQDGIRGHAEIKIGGPLRIEVASRFFEWLSAHESQRLLSE